MAIKRSTDKLKTDINKNYIIRLKHDGVKKTEIVGVDTFRFLFKTKAKANEMLKKALNSKKQNPQFKLRRGTLITFHAK